MIAGPLLAQEGEEQADLVETSAKEALIIDGETGAVLFQRNPDMRFPPASLAKLMTMAVVFDELKAGRLSLDKTFLVSEHAWRTGGAPSGTSTMFAEVNSQVPVEALIKGTIVQSANDAAIALAEGISGSEAEFAELMNEKARALGMEDSHFVNPTGLPAEGQYVTVRDMITLARHIEADYPDLYAIYSQPAFEWNGIFQRNRNPLLSMEIGADGLGTGYTEASGYSLIGVLKRGDRETFLAIGGLESPEARAAEAKKLLEWSQSAFRREELFAAGETIGRAEVYGGTVPVVGLKTREPVIGFVPVGAEDTVKATIHYEGPLRAPIGENDRVGRIDIAINGKLSVSGDLFAAESVPQGSFSSRALDAAGEFAFGWL